LLKGRTNSLHFGKLHKRSASFGGGGCGALGRADFEIKYIFRQFNYKKEFHMFIFTLIMFGGIVGWLASRTGKYFFWDIILGVLGAIIGGLAVSSFGLPPPIGYNLYSFIIALMGAVVIIFIGRYMEQISLN
jgi:uncharacterized membrane protein YeaQ/YmgE (transglycosylase-associated protein family)